MGVLADVDRHSIPNLLACLRVLIQPLVPLFQPCWVPVNLVLTQMAIHPDFSRPTLPPTVHDVNELAGGQTGPVGAGS